MELSDSESEAINDQSAEQGGEAYLLWSSRSYFEPVLTFQRPTYHFSGEVTRVCAAASLSHTRSLE